MVFSILLSLANAQEIYIDPYIQALEHNEVWIMWEDDQPETADVLWGVDSTLGNSDGGTGFEITSGHYLHSVQISGLIPDTDYYYRTENQNTVHSIFR